VPTFQEVIDLARPYDFTVAGDTRTYFGADPNARGDITAEYELFLGLGLDGVFADQPETGCPVQPDPPVPSKRSRSPGWVAGCWRPAGVSPLAVSW
jgi:hypothetical protein